MPEENEKPSTKPQSTGRRTLLPTPDVVKEGSVPQEEDVAAGRPEEMEDQRQPERKDLRLPDGQVLKPEDVRSGRTMKDGDRVDHRNWREDQNVPAGRDGHPRRENDRLDHHNWPPEGQHLPPEDTRGGHPRREGEVLDHHHWKPDSQLKGDHPVSMDDGGFRRERHDSEKMEWGPGRRTNNDSPFPQREDLIPEIPLGDRERWQPGKNEESRFDRPRRRFARGTEHPDSDQWSSSVGAGSGSPFNQDSDMRVGDMGVQHPKKTQDILERFRQGEDVSLHSRDAGETVPERDQPPEPRVQAGLNKIPSLFDLPVTVPSGRSRPSGLRGQSAEKQALQAIPQPPAGGKDNIDRTRKRPHRDEESHSHRDRASSPVKKSRFDQPERVQPSKVTESHTASKASTVADDSKKTIDNMEKCTVQTPGQSKKPNITDVKSSESEVKDNKNTPEKQPSKKPAAKASQKTKTDKKQSSGGKEESYVYTKTDELQMTPGVLGPLLSMIRGDSRYCTYLICISRLFH